MNIEIHYYVHLSLFLAKAHNFLFAPGSLILPCLFQSSSPYACIAIASLAYSFTYHQAFLLCMNLPSAVIHSIGGEELEVSMPICILVGPITFVLHSFHNRHTYTMHKWKLRRGVHGQQCLLTSCHGLLSVSYMRDKWMPCSY